ncbi:DUF4870 family protein [Thiocapsa marina]|uniref:Transmembrane protein n=1 Tax=Thiocapsa marina 5811 TaxID=768671 RepID=F9UA78_9GAMM|nr:hypothetical protein [Thiocapsa marina]EGV19026.1 transmembrane protein [Thiocapsa marina 5811]
MDESTHKVQPVSAGPDTTDPLKTTTGFVYLMQALSFILGVTSVIGVVVNYLRLAEVRGTWLESHFVWQIRTFWFQLLWGLVGLATSVFLIGFLVWGVVYFWTLYRVVKGWLNLAEERPMYAD